MFPSLLLPLVKISFYTLLTTNYKEIMTYNIIVKTSIIKVNPQNTLIIIVFVHACFYNKIIDPL